MQAAKYSTFKNSIMQNAEYDYDGGTKYLKVETLHKRKLQPCTSR